MGKIIKLLLVVGFSFVSTVLLLNYVFLHKPLSEVVEADSRNEGINVSARYAHYVYPSTLVLDIKSVSGSKSVADVFRVLLQYAERISEKQFDRVELALKGETKFYLSGEYFQKLGEEYGAQNTIYTMRTFPENVYDLDGQRAFSRWSGGLLGVVAKQMEDFEEFHRRWYIEDVD